MITVKDKRYLELAKRQALRSQHMPKRVGVVIVRGNKILALGYNKLSHPKVLSFPGIDGYNYWSLHSEIDALSKVEDARGSTTYLWATKARSKKAKPCILCEKYLKLRGVVRIVYTSVDGSIQELSL
jgi:deoxycytidylate deaminase